MSSRKLLPSVVTACLLTVGLGGVGPNAASAGQIVLKPGESARNDVVEIKHRSRGPWFYLPIAPSYLALTIRTITAAVIIRPTSLRAMSTMAIVCVRRPMLLSAPDMLHQ